MAPTAYPKARIVQVGCVLRPTTRSPGRPFGWLFDPGYDFRPWSLNEHRERLYFGYTMAELEEIEHQPAEWEIA